MAEEKVLIVDDDRAINDLVCAYIVKEGLNPYQAFCGKDALKMVKEISPHLIILDIVLPDIDGTSLCGEIRKSCDSPIMFLSSKSDEIDKIVALAVGGDDYMTKPFSAGEFMARVKAHLRRNQMRRISAGYEENVENEETYTFSELTVNMLSRDVVSNGLPVSLTPKEFSILELLIRSPKRVFSGEQLFELVWGASPLDGGAKTVAAHISILRKKIEPDPRHPKYIINVRGFGYKFNHELAGQEPNQSA